MTKNCGTPDIFGIDDPYSAKRWDDRFAAKGDAPDLRVPCLPCAALPPESEYMMPLPEMRTDDRWIKRLARVEFRANQVLVAAPTVVLIGMYGAMAFSQFSLGPAWVGFLGGAAPAAGIAAWAFSGSAKGLGD